MIGAVVVSSGVCSLCSGRHGGQDKTRLQHDVGGSGLVRYYPDRAVNLGVFL
jgi:hypothetical protein